MSHELVDGIRDWLVAIAGGLVFLALNRHLRAKDAHAAEFQQLKNMVNDLRTKIAEICGKLGL